MTTTPLLIRLIAWPLAAVVWLLAAPFWLVGFAVGLIRGAWRGWRQARTGQSAARRAPPPDPLAADDRFWRDVLRRWSPPRSH